MCYYIIGIQNGRLAAVHSQAVRLKEDTMVTIKDISKKCGVAPSTVSKALNGYDDVKPETVEKVRAAARELGYQPNTAARALKTSKSGTIGVLYTDNMRSGLSHQYFAGVLNSFKEGVERAGYDVTFIGDMLAGRPASFLEHCRYRHCDGALIACMDFSQPGILELINSGLPVVTIDHTFDNCSSVLSDNIGGISQLVRHIYALGHRRIAYIHGDSGTSATRRRLMGFNSTCCELGLDIPDEFVRAARYHDTDTCERITAELMALKEPPTCILYPDDLAIFGGMSYFEQKGIKAPDGISIAGYDGTMLTQVLNPSITTVRQDTATIGREAARLLIETIGSPKTFIPRQITVPAELLKGGTVRRL